MSALALLESKPLVEGDFYPGDVLVAELKVSTSYWRGHPRRPGHARTNHQLDRGTRC
ncbi:MAG TPA: contact-dependent growth inhibition system immunity protein [Actinophytocola sp.]|uniref:contact-dependent growth inhibition system immunity protein n=1 Tax=Actinophytocola sp. TaxID=1872138 RepID=UPI002E0A4241|nr:contact-dependent growth inhibition system immunity protein [Actinophytocola sp.]